MDCALNGLCIERRVSVIVVLSPVTKINVHQNQFKLTVVWRWNEESVRVAGGEEERRKEC